MTPFCQSAARTLFALSLIALSFTVHADDEIPTGTSRYHHSSEESPISLIEIEGAAARALFLDLAKRHEVVPCNNGTDTVYIAVNSIVCLDKPTNQMGPAITFCQTAITLDSGIIQRIDQDYCPALSIIGVSNGNKEEMK